MKNVRAALLQAQSETRMRMRELQARGAFGGPGVAEHEQPAELLLEEVQRTAGIVRWLQFKLAEEWTDELPELGELYEPPLGKGQSFFMPTKLQGWYDIYLKERGHLARIAKLCLDAGIEERQVRVAEQQAEVIYRMIQSAFDRMDLTLDQKNSIPGIMQALIREITIPGELV